MSSVVVAGSLFTVMTAPLVLFGSQPLDLGLQGRTLFTGKLESVASSYIGLAALTSLGIGSLGGRLSRRKQDTKPQTLLTSSFPATPEGSSQSNVAESQIFGLATQSSSARAELPSPITSAAEKVAELPSAPELRAAGLDFFLDENLAELQEQPRGSAHADAGATEVAVPVAPSEPSSNRATPTTPGASEISPLAAQLLPALSAENWVEAFLSDSSEIPPAPSAPLASPAPEVSAASLPSVEPPSLALPETPAPIHQAVSATLRAADPQTELTQLAPTQLTPTQLTKRPPANPVMPAAQTYLSFTHFAEIATMYAAENSRDLQLEMEALEKLEQVREQIQILSAQMETIQSSLSLQGYSTQHLVALPSARVGPTYVVSAAEETADAYESSSQDAHQVWTQAARHAVA